ncbi:carbonic anhydrase [Formivibrio citricus]|uniref:carbonic anhydrase n=1 Tax=Formivibrio citricus TaxID=83765 RepID=A0A1I4X9G6_9NEIS|nr:carbonic anhydrase family protein [Formivibrio citricus]SFN22126.1 carbonic anhydrase [Formivibrio citricus]
MRPILPFVLMVSLFGIAQAGPAPAKNGKKAAHAAEQHEKGHWSYSGHGGPAHWAELDPAFAACGIGRQQSPINIETAFAQSLDRLQIRYQPNKLAILNNGHTIQHPVEPGSHLEIGKNRYQLLQFHFHAPSEEAIGGKRYAMDIHLVHKNDAGQLAVLTVLIEQGKKDHPTFNELWHSMPGNDETRIFEKKRYSPANVLPADLSYWTFMGSLTTPPCSEGVRWLVLKTPIQLSKKQIDRFRRLYPMNARPVQPLNERAVLDAQ